MTGESAAGESASGGDTEDRDELARLFERPLRVRSLSITLLLLLGVFFAISLAKSFLLSIALAWLAKSALVPVVRALRAAGVPLPLGGAMIVVALTGIVGLGLYHLMGPAAEWVDEFPRSIQHIERKVQSQFQGMESPLKKVSEAAKNIEDLAEGGKENDPNEPVKVEVRESFPRQVFSGAWQLLVNFFITLILLYFMLATDEALLLKIVTVLPRMKDKKIAVEACHGIEREIARYLSTVVMINVALGICVGAALWLLEMPNPILWGVMAGILNFAPYIGALLGVTVVSIVSLTTFDLVAEAIWPPLVYAALNFLEGMVVSPALLGRRLELSPVILFTWLLFWSWIWGLSGALVAVPLLVALKITCDKIPRLNSIGTIIAR